MFCVLIALWLLSVVIAGTECLNDQIYFHYHRNIIILSILFRTIVSTVLLSIAKYTNNVKKRHIRAIEERQNYFGIEREKLDILKVIKKRLTGSLKLYIAAVVVMTILTFIGIIIELILHKDVISTKIVFVLILHTTDVVVIASTQHEMRIQIKRTLRMCCYRFVSAQNVVSPNVSVSVT